MRDQRDFRFINDLDRMFFGSFGPSRHMFPNNMFPNQSNQYYHQPSVYLHPSFAPEFSDFYQEPFLSGFPNSNLDPFYQMAHSNHPNHHYDQTYQDLPQNPYKRKQEQNNYNPYPQDYPEVQPRYPEKRPQQNPPEVKPANPSVPASKSPKKPESLLYLPINFIFEKTGEKQLYPLRKNISLATTIEEIQEILSFECKIDDQISIQYRQNGNFVTIDPKLTVSDVRDQIREKRCNGKEQNYMFVRIEKLDTTEKVENFNSIEKVENLTPQNNKEKVTKAKKGKSISSFRPKIQRIPPEEKTTIKTVSKKRDEKIEKKDDQKCIEKVDVKDDDEYEIERKNEEEEKIDADENDEKVPPVLNKKENLYFVKVNRDDDILEIELDDDATVMALKEKIGQIKHVKNLANIKVLFAGKELLSNLALKPLKIGDTILFVYIRSEEDILLLTAKALRVDQNEEEEEEEEEYDE